MLAIIMNNMYNNIERLGFDKWFQDNMDSERMADSEIVRVISVHRNSYVITNGEKDTFAELAGKVLFNAESPLNYPAVGDWVLAKFYNDSLAIIHEILPRKTLLNRKTSGKKIDLQLIAANIDAAFIIQSLDSNFNPRRLERYLVMINENNIRPIVLLSKSDLSSDGEIENNIIEIQNIASHITVQPFSNESGNGLERVKDLLNSGETHCLLGSSGVGKTTLLNNLIGESLFATQNVREKDSKGKHTTTHRELIILDNGAMIIDNPGMRELGMLSVESGFDNTFSEIIDLSNQCGFNDCSHINEKSCAVLDAVKEGIISKKRLQNYIKMKRESDYNDMSYFEKKQKGKQVSKFHKSVIKSKHIKKNKL